MAGELCNCTWGGVGGRSKSTPASLGNGKADGSPAPGASGQQRLQQEHLELGLGGAGIGSESLNSGYLFTVDFSADRDC